MAVHYTVLISSGGRCPLGQLPLLELGDGRVLCQSGAILRFLGNELGNWHFSQLFSYNKWKVKYKFLFYSQPFILPFVFQSFYRLQPKQQLRQSTCRHDLWCREGHSNESCYDILWERWDSQGIVKYIWERTTTAATNIAKYNHITTTVVFVFYDRQSWRLWFTMKNFQNRWTTWRRFSNKTMMVKAIL